MRTQQVFGPINNVVATQPCWEAQPQPGETGVTVQVDMPAAEVVNTTNYVRIILHAVFSARVGPQCVAYGPEWHGGPGQTPPSLFYRFPDGTPPPVALYATVVNGTRGPGSPARVNQINAVFG